MEEYENPKYTKERYLRNKIGNSTLTGNFSKATLESLVSKMYAEKSIIKYAGFSGCHVLTGRYKNTGRCAVVGTSPCKFIGFISD